MGFAHHRCSLSRISLAQNIDNQCSCLLCLRKAPSARPVWPNRDPLEEGDGGNIYAYCQNQPTLGNDFLGLWKITRNSSDDEADAEAELGDTWDGLADKLRLERGEASKWVSNWETSVECGKKYRIPNLALFWKGPIGIHVGWIEYWPTSILQIHRLALAKSKSNYASKGYKTEYVSGGSTGFKGMFTRRGIFAVAFSGHGEYDDLLGVWSGFASDIRNADIVSPGDMTANYKLQAVAAYACGTANENVSPWTHKKGKWKYFVSSNKGTWVGYEGSVSVLNVYWHEESENAGYIP